VASQSSGLTGPTITLASGDAKKSGFDFHAQTYKGNTGGDFYFYQGAFFTNNAGQRGVIDVGPNCPALTLSAMPTSGYGSGVPAVTGDCYVALTQGDSRDFVVFQVTASSSVSVSLVWDLVTSGDSGVTLTSSVPGYEFTSKTYLGASGGDFYFTSGAFWANNFDQRGLVSLGACSAVENAAALPATGYTRTGVPASVGNCYAAIMRYDPRHRIVFRVDYADAGTAILTWRLVLTPLNQLAWQHCDPYTPAVLNNTGVPSLILSNWLLQHPGIANAMQWIQPVVSSPPTTVPYPSWPSNMQTMLTDNFVAYWNWYNSGMTGADPNPGSDPPANYAIAPAMALEVPDAQSLYVKYVALSLVLEIQGRLPWSITNYDSASLAELLDARKFFTQYDSTQTYFLIPLSVTPAPPLVAAQFVAQNNFLCGNRPATIAEAVFWARYLTHYNNTSDTAGDEMNFWQYPGTPPASRVLAGTTYSGTVSGVYSDVRHWTMGCHGTTGLLKMLLRTLNIPVEHFSAENAQVTLPQDAFYSSGHAVPHFLADGLWMSHGDDPYFVDYQQLPFPLQALLVNDAQFLSWFPNPGQATVPIGQQTDELWVHYGDLGLLWERLDDLKITPPTDQNFCSVIKVNPPNNIYTCAQVEQMGLLSMLDPIVQPYLASGTLFPDINLIPTYYHNPLSIPNGALAQTFGLLNPSFVDQLSAWTATGMATMGTSGCYGDSNCLVLGSTFPTNGDSTASQTFTAPPGSTGISLWFKETCPDSIIYDWATLTLTDLSASGTVTTLLPPTCTTNGWTQITGAVTAGHNYTLTLTSHDDDYPADPTYTLYDNVVFTYPGTPASGIANGNFAAALSGWTASGASVQTAPGGHLGATALQQGSTVPTPGDSSASQTFVVPAATPNLSLWYQMTCPDSVTYDWANVTLVDNTTGASSTLLPNTCVTNAWTQITAVLVGGHSYTLTLTSHDDNWVSDPSYTLFDGVSLN
jgi:hypothetical protein